MSVVRWLYLTTPLFFLFAFTGVVSAQSDRRAIEFYIANFEQFLGKQITVEVALSTREDTGQYDKAAIFQIYTKGARERGFALAVVPKDKVKSFSRKYGQSEYSGYIMRSTRRLQGVFRQIPGDKSNLPTSVQAHDFYISVDGAMLPEETETQMADSD